ncbi:MAG TPA: NAD(P)-dependent oxidoreductase [Longimicrobiales bacterium]|nr:NAD(P)-dependent oxidoreductase [Longimicrobiales bacterium]
MAEARRVLVTGATGFIGAHALEPLHARGFEVHALTRRPERVPSFAHAHAGDMLVPAAVEGVVGDVTPTHLLHLAWCTEHGRFWSAPENVTWLEASLHLVRAFTAAGGRRMVVAGTCAEYEWNEEPCVEDGTPLRPATLYGAAKHALHTVLARYAPLHGIEYAWPRIFHLYGPGEPAARFVPAIIRACLAGTHVDTTHGSQVRDFLHASDVAGACVALLDSGVQGAVNIGSGEPVTLRDVIAVIEREAGCPGTARLGALGAPEGEPQRLVPDITRLRDEVGWSPSLDLATGIRDVASYWRDAARGVSA